MRELFRGPGCIAEKILGLEALYIVGPEKEENLCFVRKIESPVSLLSGGLSLI